MWRSVHVHDYGSHDTLLLDHLAPNLAPGSRFFFIRYWEGGPHVRLRLDTADERAFGELVERIRVSVAGRVAQGDIAEFRRAQRVLALLEGKRREDTGLVAHGTLVRARYEPEYAKYGGPRGVAVAEELFVASSRIGLGLLPAMTRGGTERLVLGVSAMLAALTGAGLAGPVLVRFLERYTHVWSGYVSRETWRSWPDRAARDRATVAGTVLAEDTPPVVAEWKHAVARAVDAVQADRGVLDHVVASGPLSGVDFLLCHYLHTHNNRLGVLPDEEAYFAFLTRTVLQAEAPV